ITIQEKYLMAQRLKWNFKNIWVKNLRFPYKKHHQFIETGDITIYKLYHSTQNIYFYNSIQIK
ncbi:MAG: hypothetical protein J6B32_08445, partial [Spirochaetaceae bacterium]|nr:hypothetical protein [Spirochaetaceae bacterium]